MSRIFPYDGGLTLREVLLGLLVMVLVAIAYGMATAPPHPTETRSSTPEAWTPQTVAPAVETEVDG